MKRLDSEDAKQLSRFLRSLHNWGQVQLAEAAGLDPKSIGRKRAREQLRRRRA